MSQASTPNIAAELIPAEAAGRDPIFFFGTLMHRAVLQAVLDRPVREREIETATLAGYRRVQALGAPYPVLVRDARSEVEGSLLIRPSLRDIRRINHFEDEEYHAMLLTICTSGGNQAAWVFLALETLAASGIAWDLDSWAELHLESFLGHVEKWMADAPG